jgi:hypothetical protein
VAYQPSFPEHLCTFHAAEVGEFAVLDRKRRRAWQDRVARPRSGWRDSATPALRITLDFEAVAMAEMSESAGGVVLSDR